VTKEIAGGAIGAAAFWDGRALDRAEALAQARAFQEKWRRCIISEDMTGDVRRVAGVDVAYDPQDKIARAGAVVLSFPELKVLDTATACLKITFPYITGYLSFREAPAALAALQKLSLKPDLLLCDGQGLAHPRRFGLACHLGLAGGLPAIGVAKSRLVGEYQEPPLNKGDHTPLRHRGEIVGAVLRTRAGVKPVFVSCGHKVSLKRALELVLACCPRFRLPEPIRQAHHLAADAG